MKFFYENCMGDNGYFSEKNLVKAIYTAWNIEADLYLLNDGVKKIDEHKFIREQAKLIFAPHEENEFNSDILKEFGYRMEDGEEFREIIDIKTGKIIRYNWSEVKQLI
jgi:hypothetical protein